MKKKIFFILFSILLIFLISLAYFNNKSVEALSGEIYSSKKETTFPKVVSFITPHHLLAKKIINNIFSLVAEKDKNDLVERIVLISPNHFNLGRGGVISSTAQWKTGKDSVEPDKDFVDLLEKKGLVHVENDAFQKEHGIENVVPYMKEYFPKTKVVPLMISENVLAEKIDEIAKFIFEQSNGKTLVILSADFSHYLEEKVATLHDQKAVDVMSSMTLEDVSNLDIDCAAGLSLLMKFSSLGGFEDFKFHENSNSSKIYGSNLIGETTSYVTGYYQKGNKKEPQTASILFLGDLMLDRYVRTFLEKTPDLITEKIKRLFYAQDLNVVNLEGPITTQQSVSVGSAAEEKNNFIFTFDPKKSIEFLKENRIKLVSLGNNHTLNFEAEGLAETKSFLSSAEVAYFGNPLDEKNYFSKNIHGLKIAFVNYNQFSVIKAEKVVEIIREIRKNNDFVVVYAHWGDEYALVENEKQKKNAHSFVDAGADVIIGSHPHVVQPLEIYKGKIILYSLGNFVFDQYFSEDTRTMLAAMLAIEKNKVEIALVPLYQGKGGQIDLADKQKRQILLSRLANDSQVDYNIRQGILSGYLDINR